MLNIRVSYISHNMKNTVGHNIQANIEQNRRNKAVKVYNLHLMGAFSS
jgi:hypothetical protein